MSIDQGARNPRDKTSCETRWISENSVAEINFLDVGEDRGPEITDASL